LTMKAAVLQGPRDIRLVDVEIPRPKADEILVKVEACGICGTDLHAYRTGLAASEGKILGHEFSGVVAEVGKPVEGVAVGDRVAGTGYRNCGRCYWCQQNQLLRCTSPVVPGEGLDGAFAEYVIVPNPMPGKMLFHLSEDIPWTVGATLEPLSVACFAVSRARIEPGDTVLVLGAGMIGQCIIQVCKALGAKLIVSELSSLRLQAAREGGADVLINPKETDLSQSVVAITSGEMANVVFECSGSPSAFCLAPQLVRPFGRIIQVGMFEQKVEIEPDLMSMMFAYRNLTIRGSGGQRWDMAVDLMEKGQFKASRLVSHSFTLDSIGEAFETQLD
jgi:threonine dehydrogenase-like Zn-dependent dehydrogenase